MTPLGGPSPRVVREMEESRRGAMDVGGAVDVPTPRAAYQRYTQTLRESASTGREALHAARALQEGQEELAEQCNALSTWMRRESDALHGDLGAARREMAEMVSSQQQARIAHLACQAGAELVRLARALVDAQHAAESASARASRAEACAAATEELCTQRLARAAERAEEAEARVGAIATYQNHLSAQVELLHDVVKAAGLPTGAQLERWAWLHGQRRECNAALLGEMPRARE